MPLEDAEEARNVFVREARRIAKKEFVRWFMLTRKLAAKLKKLEETDPGIPSLFVMGEDDYLFLAPIKEQVKKFTNQTLAIVEKCGHVVNIEKAAVFNQISIDFIKKVGLQPSKVTS
jgi:pimeloyl-ACP methyl ester carboxylesterase